MLKLVWSPGTADCRDAFAIRREVFIDEQGYRDEFDADDRGAWHLTLYREGRPAAALRLIPGPGGVFRIGRVAVRRALRGRHLGTALMREGLKKAAAMGAGRIEIGAQQHAVPFYRRLGFRPSGKPYLEEGHPHVPMAFDLPAGPEEGNRHGV